MLLSAWGKTKNGSNLPRNLYKESGYLGGIPLIVRVDDKSGFIGYYYYYCRQSGVQSTTIHRD